MRGQETYYPLLPPNCSRIEEATRISSKRGLVMLESSVQIAQKGTAYSLKDHMHMETGSCISHVHTVVILLTFLLAKLVSILLWCLSASFKYEKGKSFSQATIISQFSCISYNSSRPSILLGISEPLSDTFSLIWFCSTMIVMVTPWWPSLRQPNVALSLHQPLHLSQNTYCLAEDVIVE